MAQSSFLHANRFSDSQEIPRPHFVLPEGSLTHSQPSPVDPILIQNNPVHAAPSLLCRIHFVLFSHLRLVLPSGRYPSGFPLKNLYAPLFFPIRATCLSHLIDLVLITRIVFGERRGPKASRYAVFSSTLLPRPSYARIYSSAPCSQMPSAYVPPSH